jgi:hypothetical protein
MMRPDQARREPSSTALWTRVRGFLAMLVAVAASLTIPASVSAVIGGEPTGAGRYSNVGLLSLPGAFCSGTLVSPTVFLTAAHCVVSDGQGARAIVTFDPTVSFDANDEVVGPSVAGTAYYDGRFDDPPRHGGTRGFIDQTAFDLAVVVLDRPASDVFPGITPAVLPTLDRLDAYARSAKAKDSAAFTSVGYGVTRDARGNPHNVDFDGVRRLATGPLYRLDPAVLWIRGNLNAAWAVGSTCNGDSGGPDFLGTSNTIVSVHSFGNEPCHNVTGNVRLDTAPARSFLATYAVPTP